MAALFFGIGIYASPIAAGEPWYRRDFVSLGPAEVIGALAALSTGTIALQVMAQTAFSKQSQTLAEFNHRQNMGMLALTSPAVSCTLAIFALLDREAVLPGGLAYILIVTTIAGMNTFIAADAADRLLRVDDNNVDVQIAAQRKVLGHYRRKRLPHQPEASSFGGRFLRAFRHILVVSAAVAGAEVLLVAPVDWERAPGYFLIFTISTTIISALASVTARYWFGVDRANSWGCALLLFVIVVTFTLVILGFSDEKGLIHVLAILGIPIAWVFPVMITTTNRSRWLVPGWVPGTWVRAAASRSVHQATQETAIRLTELKVDKKAKKSATGMGFWGLVAERSRTILSL